MMEKVLSKELKLLSELKGLTDSQLKNIGAILILTHYRHAIPDFKEKDWYISEIKKDGDLRQECFKRKHSKAKQERQNFMDKHFIVQ